MHCIINNEIIPVEKAVIGISDLALQRGYGIFDFFKTVNGRPVFFDAHLDRFYRSADAMRLTPPHERNDFKKKISELLAVNSINSSGVKITLTGGYSVDGFTPGSPNLIVVQSPMPPLQGIQREGIRIITYAYKRQVPFVKSTDYLMAVWLQPQIKEQGAQDVLYHWDGIITECPRANIFIVTKDKMVLTPVKDVLQGISRSRLLSTKLSYPVIEADISLQDVYDAAEVFITSTTKNVLPVTVVDNKVIGRGEAGEVTCVLSEELEALIQADVSGSHY
ncbi:MAG: amino acid aminotransferase [Chitinophagaceae bacterium]|nr:MAG: amino acid aminotransferase [Chitinophagaceae bacterium]